MDAGGQSLLLGEPDVGADPLSGGYMQLSESRRMRSEELHYLDHPAMGAIIKITALDEDALESWAEAELMQSEDWPASLRTRAAP